MFPHSSSAVHSRTKVYVPVQVPGVIVESTVIVGVGSQLSVAVMSVPITGNTGIASHSIVTSAGMPASTGAVKSCTVIV